MKAGWQNKKLGELAQLKGRIGWRGLTAKEYTETGPLFLSVHCLNYGDYVDFRDAFHITNERYLESPEIMVKSGDVLICKDGAGIGKVGIVGEILENVTINSSLLLVRSSPSILPKFLYRCLSSPYFQNIVNSRLNGATTPHLYQRDITEFPVVLPPLSEQHRIVAILDETFEGISAAKTNAERNLKNARELFESYLQSVFTQKGKGWLEKPFGDLASFRNGINFTKSSQGESIRILGVKDFQKSFWAPLENLDSIIPEGRVLDTDILQSDDLVFVRSNGNPELIGRCLLIGCHSERTTHSGFTIRARLNTSEISPLYLCHFVKSEQAHRQLVDGGNGVNIKSLNQGTLSNLKIPFPSSLQKQLEIVENLSKMRKDISELELLYQRKIDSFDELWKALLHKAFNAEL